MLKAITRRATSVDAKVKSLNAQRASGTPPLPPLTVSAFFDHYAETEDTDVVVENADFQAAIRELVPSVSVKELEHYDRVRKTFEQGDDGAKEGATALNKVMQKANGRPKSSSAKQQDEDEFIIRTEGLSLDDRSNGHAGTNGAPIGGMGGKGKGKAKEVDVNDFGFGKAMDDEEELYSP